MANNYGLMLAAGGAALIGFVFLSMGKDALADEEGKEFNMSDFEEDYVPNNLNPDGTVTLPNGQRVIPNLPKKAWVVIQECEYVRFDKNGDPICGKGSIYDPDRTIETGFPKETDSEPWYGSILDFITGSPQQDQILERAEDPEDSKLYMFSGAPVIESIGITKPAWLEEQDPDPIQ